MPLSDAEFESIVAGSGYAVPAEAYPTNPSLSQSTAGGGKGWDAFEAGITSLGSLANSVSQGRPRTAADQVQAQQQQAQVSAVDAQTKKYLMIAAAGIGAVVVIFLIYHFTKK